MFPHLANSLLSRVAWSCYTVLTKQILFYFHEGVNLNSSDVTSLSLTLAHWPIVVGYLVQGGGAGMLSGRDRKIREG